jgi:hypothetical protein
LQVKKSEQSNSPAASVDEQESGPESDAESSPTPNAAKAEGRMDNRGRKYPKCFRCVFKLSLLDQIRELKKNGNEQERRSWNCCNPVWHE